MVANMFFNDLEAIKIAIDIEKRGERFYIMAANKIKDTGLKDMFLNLAQEERDHADTFEDLYNGFAKDKENFDDTYLFEPEIASYLSAMVETVVFPSDHEQDKVMEGIEGAEDVLKLGIQAEKDSILFYTEMIMHSKLAGAKEAFRKLLHEEKEHLMDLRKELADIKNK